MNNNIYKVRPPYPNGKEDRFIFPFLTGALIGGAAVGITRPRPIINAAPPYGPRPPYPAPYSYYSYGGYVPGPYGY